MMDYALAADAIFSTPGEDWGEDATLFYHEYLDRLAEIK